MQGGHNNDDLAFFRFLSLVTLTCDISSGPSNLDLQTPAKFLYSVPNRQVWSSYF